MTDESAAILYELLRENDLGGWIDDFVPNGQALPHLLSKLAELTTLARGRFGPEISFSPEALRQEALHNPRKIRAFLQALRITDNAEMLLMVRRVLDGLSIREVAMNYREQESFGLRVVLARPNHEGGALETYTSDDISDAALLRHFGILRMDGQPVFDGFYAVRSS